MDGGARLGQTSPMLLAHRGTSAFWEEVAKVRRLRGDARGAEEAAREAQRMKEERPGRDR